MRLLGILCAEQDWHRARLSLVLIGGSRDRVSTTALATLCLQAAYRTLPAYWQ